MPSPFPGMDPYLEAPHLWPDFHARFVPALSDALAPLVEPRYVVTLDERVNVSYDWEGPEYMRPDVAVLRGDEDHPVPSTHEGMRGATPVLIPLDMGELPREVVLEVHEQSSGKLVTVVELLSPSNKDGGSETRRKYLRKRRSIVASDTHLVELDLLRGGRRMPMGRPLPPAPYYVTVSREERRPTAEVFPIELSQPLPTVPIPLLPPDAAAQVSLQDVFADLYDRARYCNRIDYAAAPVPAFTKAQEEFADRLLRELGKR